MSPLVRVALDLLEDPTTAPGLGRVACVGLLTALNEGVETPKRAPMAVWRWLLASGSGASALHLHELPSEEVAKDALRILTSDPDAGEDARDLAMAVLRGENLCAVTDTDIFVLSERVMDEGRTRRFTFLVEGVHESRGLSADIIRILRDRLAASAIPAVRAAGVEVGALHRELDDQFTERMLADHSPVVRRAVLEMLEKAEVADRSKAAALVRNRLSSETHRTVIAAGLTTLGTLVRREPGFN